MVLTIDNLDGQGALDYTSALDASQPAQIRRTLNAPSLLTATLVLANSQLAVPARRARVTASSQAGAVLFTGYLATEPVAVYAGVASEGPVFRYSLAAASDEWLLDKQSAGAPAAPGYSALAGDLITAYTQRLAGSALAAPAAGARALGVYAPSAEPWSAHAGAIAAATYSSYRAASGAVALAPFASVQHVFSDGAGSLHPAALTTSQLRQLANDITVTGADEPSTYWTEIFTGDGTTAVFPLLGDPTAPNAGHATLVAEPFNQPSLNLEQWRLSDPGSHLALSGGGLALSGGNGLDGQTTLTGWDPVECGGTLILELSSVLLTGFSAGVIGGLYSGTATLANCFAGFRIRQSGGNTLATPVVNGVEAGTSLTLLSGHAYTLRIRLHAPETLRVRQSFYAFVDVSGGSAVNRFGLGLIDSPAQLVFEARDQGVSSNTPVTLLYDSAATLTGSPANLNLVAVNSLQLFGSIGSLHLKRTGSCWIESRSATGVLAPRLTGTAAEGADCTVASNGAITFFPGRVPLPGETVTVTYRGRRRAVARVSDPVSLATEAAGGAIGSARWLGHITQPPARSSEDCENAALALLSFARSRAAALAGTYTAINPATTDVWPGDVLSLAQANGTTLNAIIRSVHLSTHNEGPEALTYHIGFANEWAEGLGIKLSESIPQDTLVPATPLPVQPALTLAPHVLANLPQITIGAPSGGFFQVDAGMAPPVGGGFEVRRRDGGFGATTAGTLSGDLVLRSPVRSFSIPLAATPEAFFIRMYDASVPPLYSRLSTAILSHQPIR